ncbi:DUF2283 domain-containing protein [Azospirillum sp. TSO35-2]|uniref:DUF2283 domain-containing protein n=1 Tax=Azospirillum sp. TSO35-2 TaxID=716796 RepID=UPI000D612CE6|nr:DUF2283 domain-containing protein [Azospirillum sp. TSO35-2]PWC31007.1 hypothetical protein TSO352_29580 [Azospirillum sp. TSO35-2]
MKTHYDPDADALYLRFSDHTVEGSEEVAPGIILDFDDQHRIVALEVLNAREKMASGALPIAAE